MMKNKIFISFLVIIMIGLLGSMNFARLIYRDFHEYSENLRKDQLEWIITSIETAYEDRGWNREVLFEAIHWGLMLGFDIELKDMDGKSIISSKNVMDDLPEGMRKKMEEIIDPQREKSQPVVLPIYRSTDYTHRHHFMSSEKGIEPRGLVYIRYLKRWGMVKEKEEEFKGRLKTFLISSILFVTLSSIIASYILSTIISSPLKRLKEATEKITSGNLDVRVEEKGNDEVSALGRSFNQMVKRLKNEDNLRRHLGGAITHELKTPLTIIKGNIEGIRDGVMEIETGLKNIEKEMERLNILVENMNEAIRAEASLFTHVKNEIVHLRDLVANIVTSFEIPFRKKGLYLKTEIDEITINSDPDKLSIILRNLLVNSLKFTEEGGAMIRARRDIDNVIITVSDTGKGIPDKDIPNIFKRFYKSDDSFGFGIGLSIVHDLVKLLNGEISVSSVEGRGSEFKIILNG